MNIFNSINSLNLEFHNLEHAVPSSNISTLTKVWSKIRLQSI